VQEIGDPIQVSFFRDFGQKLASPGGPTHAEPASRRLLAGGIAAQQQNSGRMRAGTSNKP
jgi:hypothetical protein